MNAYYRTLIVAEDREHTDVWLKKNNLTRNIDDIVEIDKSPLGDNLLRTVERERSKGKIDFVITDNTELVKQLLEVGIPALVFLSPWYTRPEFRPDAKEGVKSWDSITAELDKQQGVFMEDQRLSSEEELNDREWDDAE
jgi:hypothetical protein